MNVVELEYKLLKALESELGGADVSRTYGNSKFAFRLQNNQQANVTIDVADIVFCRVKTCGEPIMFPSYQQTKHAKCEDAEEDLGE